MRSEHAPERSCPFLRGLQKFATSTDSQQKKNVKIILAWSHALRYDRTIGYSFGKAKGIFAVPGKSLRLILSLFSTKYCGSSEQASRKMSTAEREGEKALHGTCLPSLSTPTWTFMPTCTDALLRGVHLLVAFLLPVFGRRKSTDDRGVHDGSLRKSQAPGGGMTVSFREEFLSELVGFRKMVISFGTGPLPRSMRAGASHGFHVARGLLPRPCR